MKKIGFAMTSSLLVLFCLATAIVSHAQTFTSLNVFTGGSENESEATFVQGTDGNFYGTTASGGKYKVGNIFKMTPSGEITNLYAFCSKLHCPDGDLPTGALVLGSNGNFYGTTFEGGTGSHCPANSGDCGTVFEITPKGALTTLYSFCSQANCADGNNPTGLTLGTDGNFYGTTEGYGGTPTCVGVSKTGCGTVFKITPTGTLTVLHEFCSATNCSDGYAPDAALALGIDGNFYGTTLYGGTNNKGTVFKITPEGTFTTLYAFCAQANCADGSGPQAALAQGANGDFYGTTAVGGANINCDDNSLGCGTIFEITSSGQLTTLYNFCPVEGCADGSLPTGALSLGTDGNFYGTTQNGGANNYGTIFQLTSSGQFNSLYSFFCDATGCSDGAHPTVGLVQGTNGAFYGTTVTGGNVRNNRNLGDGVAYSWSMNLGPFVEAQLNFGTVGQIVTILGNNLTGATSVTFDGTSAKFKVESSMYLIAEVPKGATTGPIQVVTPSGTLNSNVAFQVLP
jgi:uncharacterized repeat protein (TIGR03803 family)